MKNEKLELLLNKVVEFNKPDAVNFKGFLYKDGRGYYIKVVEHISGTDVAVNDKLYLKMGEEEFIIHADKPKLMRVDKNSWHYNLMKYVLGSKTPTPQNMQNGCPYYWLVVFSLLVCVFVALWKTLKFIFLLIPEFFLSMLEYSVDAWIKNLDDISAYEMYENQYSSSKNVQKLPVTAKIFFDNNDENFFNYFLTKKYGEGAKNDKAKKDQIITDWNAWRTEVREARDKRNNERWAKEEEQRKQEVIREAKRAASKAAWDARMKPLNEGMVKLFDSIREAFTFKGDVKSLIKRTKQIVGAIVTLILLTAAFFIVEGLAYVLILFIDFSINCWYIYAILLALAVAVGLIYFIGVFIGGWLQKVVNQYNRGKKVWYVEPLIYLLWYPVKYIGLALGYVFLYIIWKPLEFIFYTFLWKLVLVNLAKFIWKGLFGFGRGLANSTGIFGEYFSASYTDYCPGIEWTGFDDEQK